MTTMNANDEIASLTQAAVRAGIDVNAAPPVAFDVLAYLMTSRCTDCDGKRFEGRSDTNTLSLCHRCDGSGYDYYCQ